MALLAGATTASAHLERPSYWPNPAPDTSVTPAAGGGVPDARSLRQRAEEEPARASPAWCAPAACRATARPRAQAAACSRTIKAGASQRKIRRCASALAGARRKLQRRGQAQPVDQGGAALAGQHAARGRLQDPPLAARIVMRRKQRLDLLSLNKRLLKLCKTNSVQKAVNAVEEQRPHRDHARPLHRAEVARRSRPTTRSATRPAPEGRQRRRHAELRLPGHLPQRSEPDLRPGPRGQGQAARRPPRSRSPRDARAGARRCIRCNIQIEGSGVMPEDVLLDAGGKYKRQGARPDSKPGAHAKHVVFRADRSDGFVGRNFLFKGAREHGFYTEETDGILLDKVEVLLERRLRPPELHDRPPLIQNCDGFGSGDAVVYPGAAPETGESQRRALLARRAAQEQHGHQKCDLHGSALGYSGSMGNSVRITQNHIYGNTTASRATRCPPPATPASRPTAGDRQQLHLLEQPRPLQAEPAGRVAGADADRHRHLLPGHERRPRARQLHLRQLAPRRAAVRGARLAGTAARARATSTPGISLPRRAGQRHLDLLRQPDVQTTRWAWPRPASSLPADASTSSATRARRARRARAAQRHRLLVGRVRRATPATAGSTTRAPTGRRAASPARAQARPPDPLPSNCQTSTGTGDIDQAGHRARLRRRTRRGHRPARLRLVADAAAARHRPGGGRAAADGGASGGVHAQPTRPCDATTDR